MAKSKPLSVRVRTAIANDTIEAAAAKWGVSLGTLYSLLRGEPIGSVRTLRRLQAAGVKAGLPDLADFSDDLAKTA